MKKNLLILFCIFICINKIYSQSNWELLHPKPTARTGKDVVFVTNNIGYIITSDELLETLDAGNTWLKKQDISSGNDISFYNTTGFIVGEDQYVLKSIDNGASWNQISTGYNGSFNTVNVIDNNNIILSTSNSIIITTDGGATWTRLFIHYGNVAKTFFTSPSIGHAIRYDGTIIKTTDGGQNWYTTQNLTTSSPDFLTVYFINENIGFATRESRKIFKTIDAGETWIEGYVPGENTYAFHFIDENNGFITGEYGATFKTSNGGSSWDQIFFQDGWIEDTSMYGIYFQDRNVGYATGAHGRIIKTTNGGATWTPHSKTYNDFTQIKFVNDNIGFTQSEGNLYKTIDRGITWDVIGPIRVGTLFYNSSFTFVNDSLGYAATQGYNGGHVYKTIDGGVTWNALNQGAKLANDGISSIFFKDENNGIISGGSNQNPVLKTTTNGGQTWTIVSNHKFGQIQFVNDLVGYGKGIGSYYASIYKTIDGGNTWNKSIELAGKEIYTFHFVNENTGYFVGNKGLIYKTNNGGNNWRKLNNPYGTYTEESYTQVKFYTEVIGYIVDENGKIYKTENGGLNWRFLTQQYRVNSIEIIDNYIFTAGSNGKLYRSATGILSVDDFSQNHNQKLLIYPNPATEVVNIIKSNISEKVNSIEIYNSLGQRIYYKDIFNDSEIKINVSNFTKGIYIIKVNFKNTKVATSKLILN